MVLRLALDRGHIQVIARSGRFEKVPHKEQVQRKMRRRGPKYPSTCMSILATCRQIREEGLRIFFSSNSFAFPAGPVEDLRSWLNDIPPAHMTMVKTMALTITPLDLSHARFYYLASMVGRCGDTVRHHRDCACSWIAVFAGTLTAIWREKLLRLMEWGEIRGVNSYAEVTKVLTGVIGPSFNRVALDTWVARSLKSLIKFRRSYNPGETRSADVVWFEFADAKGWTSRQGGQGFGVMFTAVLYQRKSRRYSLRT